MWQSLYRRARRLASPVHPNRIRARVKGFCDRRGWTRRYHLAIAALERFIRRADPRRHAALLAAAWQLARQLAHSIGRRRRDPRLTVAVDVTAFWEPLTGIGWYLYRLLEQLAHEPGLALRLYGPNFVDTPDLPPRVVDPPAGPAIEMVTYTVPAGMGVAYERMVGWLRGAASWLIAADGNRLLFAPNYFLPESFRRARGELVATVHDLSFERVPWTLRDSTRQNLETHLRRTLERAARILTDSETVRGELLESGRVGPERVAAIHLGPGPLAGVAAAGQPPPGLPERFVLHVGTLEPRKNLPVLLAAWRLLRQREVASPALVFCGRYGWKTEALEREIEAAVGEGWLHTFGYLDNAHVAALYERALFVVLPSIYEGFGLPAVEAMSAGVPLVASDIPVLREIAGEAALYVAPDDVEAWAATCRAVAHDAERRAELAALGRARSSRYDWRRTAAATAAVWYEVAGRTATVAVRAEEVSA